MTTIQQRITDFEVIDHGVDGEQYFQGCGVAFSEFEHVQTGCGESAADAFNDALEAIASSGNVDLSAIEQSDDGRLFASDDAKAMTVEKVLRGQGHEYQPEDCDCHYYVSIRYNVA